MGERLRGELRGFALPPNGFVPQLEHPQPAARHYAMSIKPTPHDTPPLAAGFDLYLAKALAMEDLCGEVAALATRRRVTGSV